jgi:23S rRNA pseudouridine2605 synthase
VKQRIQKLLANAGVESRRHVEEMIRQGRVAVNGKIMVDLPILVDPREDRVEVDGERIILRQSKDEKIYILLNKPKDVYSTNVAQGEQTRAVDLLPPDLPSRVYPVGRLDAQTKGLLLLTNDGDMTHRLTHPKFGIPLTYRATVAGSVSPTTLSELEKGIWLADPRTGRGVRAARSEMKIVRRTNEMTILEVTIREGRNPLLRRALAGAGHKVRDLVRVRMGTLTLHGLASGESRLLTFAEVRELRKRTSDKKGKED